MIDECIFCNSKDKRCFICKGKGNIAVQRCPRAHATEYGLFPYYKAYHNSNDLVWPDGRGRYYQPLKLINAFDILNYYWPKYESKYIEQVNKNAKKN